MPVDMTRYPDDWDDIRAAILERAQHRCEQCGIPNHVYRVSETHYRYAECVDGVWLAWNHQTEDDGAWIDDPQELADRPSRIVLTIAHVNDPDPMNCDPSNLQALCQRCHNRLDAPMRAKHARETRRRKAISATGQQEMEL